MTTTDPDERDATHGDLIVHIWNELADERGVPRITPDNDPRNGDGWTIVDFAEFVPASAAGSEDQP